MDGPAVNRGQAAVVVLSLLILACIPFDLVPLLRGPAPYPPEWQWAFRPGGPARPLIGAVLLVLTILGLLVASGSGWARRHRARAFRLLVTLAVVLGFLLQLALLAREPGSPLRTLLGRARSRSYSSYHAVALSAGARDPRAFLRHHAQSLRGWSRSARHAATHPPGPVLFYRGALAVCEACPALTDVLLDACLGDEESPSRWTALVVAALVGAQALLLARYWVI
jgi:hypothetical protein